MYDELELNIKKVQDIAQKQIENRRTLTWYKKSDLAQNPELANKEFCIEHGKLADLMYHWEHYFDKGYFVDMTPEELKSAIVGEIYRINNPDKGDKDAVVSEKV